MDALNFREKALIDQALSAAYVETRRAACALEDLDSAEALEATRAELQEIADLMAKIRRHGLLFDCAHDWRQIQSNVLAYDGSPYNPRRCALCGEVQ